MQEHPVPQNVTGYEFHLIGSMTLKQFMEVAVGVVCAVLVYWTNLPLVFKYPLMAFVGLLGVALAFVPLEGRPLDRWFFAFIKSIYQPTMFFWKKTTMTPPVFTYSPPKDLDRTPQINYAPIRQSRLQEYVHTVKVQEEEKDEESRAADELLKLFSEPQPTKVTPSSSQTARVIEMNIPPPITPTVTTPSPVSGEVKLPETSGIIKKDEPLVIESRQGVTPDLMPPTDQLSSQSIQDKLHAVVSPTITVSTDATKPVQVLQGFPFPNKPTKPNMLSGMVVTNEDKIVEGAILTITRQSDNTPVRAIKTNALGQFSVVTPLEKGSYTILTEKDGLRFDKYSLVLNNQVVEPILIKSQ